MGLSLRRKGTERLKILLTEGSSTSARQTVYCLGHRHTLDLLDPSRFCQCRFSRLVRSWHCCPSYSRHPREYLEFLGRWLVRRPYDVLFPTHEEVYLLSRYRDELGRQVRLALPEFDAVRKMQSKADFVRLLDGLGLPVPETVLVRSRKECQRQWEYPVYLKSAHGTAGRGVRQVHDAEQLSRAADEFEQMGCFGGQAEVLVQRPAKGVHSVVQAVFQYGRMLAAHSTEAVWTGIGGGQMLRVAARHPLVIEQVRRLGEHLCWHGPLFLEYFYDSATGQAQYIEANPRIGETFNARLCGVNLCELVVRIALGEEPEPVESRVEGVRSHVGFVRLLSRAQGGANRRELLIELRNQIQGRGEYHASENELTHPCEDWWSVIPAAAVLVQLLARPSRAHAIVRNTVENYGLSQVAVPGIDALPDGLLHELVERPHPIP